MMKANIYISSNKNCIPEGENEVKLDCKDKCLRWQPNSYRRISVKEFIVLAETEIESKQLVSNENYKTQHQEVVFIRSTQINRLMIICVGDVNNIVR